MNFIVSTTIGIESELNSVIQNGTETITIKGHTENLITNLKDNH